ncbi:unnamed protein product [Moneuplotes crassus]|uniref:Uncharacterized protein n=1 Tax=Euplotes crassus TaxID=5936 RepID=A0AAD2CY40_EUPCR|nr:unnamed protein product [Moneuplotes crassus]
MHNGHDMFVNEDGDVSFDSDIIPNFKGQNAFSFSHPLSRDSSSEKSNSDLNGYCKPEPYSSEVSCDTSNSIREKIRILQRNSRSESTDGVDHSKVLISSLNSSFSNFQNTVPLGESREQEGVELSQEEKSQNISESVRISNNTTREIKFNMACTCCEKCLSEKEKYNLRHRETSKAQNQRLPSKTPMKNKGKMKINLSKYLKTSDIKQKTKKVNSKSYSMSIPKYGPHCTPQNNSGFQFSVDNGSNKKYRYEPTITKQNSFACETYREGPKPSRLGNMRAQRVPMSPYSGISNLQEQMRQK